MAYKFKSKVGWTVVELNTVEAFQALPGTLLICDHSNEFISGNAYYIPVLNHLLCKEAYDEWDKSSKFYPEDVPYETRNYESIKSRISIKEK